MFRICRSLVPCGLLSRVDKIVLCNTPRHIPVAFELGTCHSKMAQRSITSFFKLTPPKPKKLGNVDVESEVINEGCLSNGKTKLSSKRARSVSSGSDDVSSEHRAPAASKKKMKLKRQRIDSSDSEPGSPAPGDTTTIKVEKPETPLKQTSSKQSPSCEGSHTKGSSPKLNGSSRKGGGKTKSPKVLKEKSLNENDRKESRAQTNGVRNNCSSPKKIKQEDNIKVEPENSVSDNNSKIVLKKKNSEDSHEEIVKSEDVRVKQENKESGAAKAKVAGVDYNPAKSKYHPIDDACWMQGEEVPYLALAKTLEAIEATSARLKIVEILSNYFRSVIALTPDDLLPSVYMCLNRLAPAYESLELGIAETYLMKAVGRCTGRSLAQLRAAAAGSGDLGLLAEQARATQRTMFAPPPLVLRRVFAALQDIARMTGQASVNKKINKIQSLYVACKHSEARYLIRSLEGKLRIGLAEQSVLQALALAAATTPPDPAGVKLLDASRGVAPDRFKALVDETALTIKTTYCECPDYGRLLRVLLQEGVAALPLRCRLRPGLPLKPMLAHPTRGVAEIFDRFEKESFTCEWKYDGERAQIHVPGDDAPDFARAAVFSRNQENNTSKYPDVLRRLPALLKPSVSSCVLDCEVVAYDTATEQILPFQVLSTRKRKDAAEADIKVQVCVFVFDLLFLNGRALVREPLQARRALLREHFNAVQGQWQFATARDCRSVDEVQQFLEEAVRGSCEGLMVKTLAGDSARYDIARRSHNWLKLKKDYLEGAGDTIDAVVIGAYRGRGKRGGLFGGFLLACHDPDAEEFQSLCKIGTGFGDQQLAQLTAELQPLALAAPRPYYRFERSQAPDVWLRAARVWEVRCADLSLSPAHRAAIGRVDAERGISLRFPRFVRARDDKAPEQATSARQIADMYLAQDQVRNSAAARAGPDDFY